ncbi:MAG: hypothetical protein GYB68_15350 [Chloroflexi bacterium]|nr:hypothetical protein [Chloroflexota bacterium]
MRLFITNYTHRSGVYGGTYRIQAITEAALQAGHEVAIFTSKQRSGTFAPLGVTIFEGSALQNGSALSRLGQQIMSFGTTGRLNRTPESLWDVLASGFASNDHFAALVGQQVDAISSFRPDVVLTDIDPAALIAADLSQLPAAYIFQSAYMGGAGAPSWRRVQQAIEHVYDRYRRAGPSPEELYFTPSTLKIIPSIPELDSFPPGRPDAAFVGNLVLPDPVDFEPSSLIASRRYIYVHIRQSDISVDKMKQVLPEVFPAGSEFTCVVYAPSLSTAHQVANVAFWPTVGIDAILRHSEWVICHGGMNITVRALAAGMPVIMFPGNNFERRFQAEHIERNGAGFMGEDDQFNVEWLNGALSYRDEIAHIAARLGESVEKFGGAPQAIREVARWASQPA